MLPELSIILPCYNEGPTLARSLERVGEVAASFAMSFELILIDDASSDGTAAEVEAFARRTDVPVRTVFHRRNLGRGATVREGLSLSEGEVVGFLDVDLEIGPEHIPRFVEAIRGGADVATAHRRYRVAPRDLHRYVASRVYAWLVRRRLRLPFADTEAGYKFFASDASQALAAETHEPGWFWDTEVLAVALRKGMRVVELECPYVRRRDKPSTVRLIPDTIEYLRAMRRFERR